MLRDAADELPQERIELTLIGLGPPGASYPIPCGLCDGGI